MQLLQHVDHVPKESACESRPIVERPKRKRSKIDLNCAEWIIIRWQLHGRIFLFLTMIGSFSCTREKKEIHTTRSLQLDYFSERRQLETRILPDRIAISQPWKVHPASDQYTTTTIAKTNPDRLHKVSPFEHELVVDPEIVLSLWFFHKEVWDNRPN